MLHLKCANYVAHFWKRAFICHSDKLNPVDHDWQIYWSSLKPEPDAMLEMISCKGKAKTCITNKMFGCFWMPK